MRSTIVSTKRSGLADYWMKLCLHKAKAYPFWWLILDFQNLNCTPAVMES